MRRASSDRHYWWLLAHMKGESIQGIASRERVHLSSVRGALVKLGVAFGKTPAMTDWRYRAAVDDSPAGARDAYRVQKRHARKRGIEWQFTFETWWAVWRCSGNWNERGCTRGSYCMARTGDKGPYSPTNVRICLVSENHAEAHGTRKLLRAGLHPPLPRVFPALCPVDCGAFL